jgi:hypothetical protein
MSPEAYRKRKVALITGQSCFPWFLSRFKKDAISQVSPVKVTLEHSLPPRVLTTSAQTART